MGIREEQISHMKEFERKQKWFLENFKPILEEMAKAVGATIDMLPRDILRLVRVTPTKMVYHHTMKGIKHALWQKV